MRTSNDFNKLVQGIQRRGVEKEARTAILEGRSVIPSLCQQKFRFWTKVTEISTICDLRIKTYTRQAKPSNSRSQTSHRIHKTINLIRKEASGDISFAARYVLTIMSLERNALGPQQHLWSTSLPTFPKAVTEHATNE